MIKKYHTAKRHYKKKQILSTNLGYLHISLHRIWLIDLVSETNLTSEVGMTRDCRHTIPSSLVNRWITSAQHIHTKKLVQMKWGRWKRESWKCGSGKRGTRQQGWKTREWKTRYEIAGVENTWKTRQHNERVENSWCDIILNALQQHNQMPTDAEKFKAQEPTKTLKN